MSFLNLLNQSARFCMAPEGDDKSGGGGGGGDDKAGDNKNTSMIDADKIKAGVKDETQDQNKQVVNQDDPNKKNDVVDQPGQKIDRPEWLKEDKFWDAEKGQIKAEELNKSYAELQAKFSKGDHKAPAKPEDYKINLTDEQKVTLFGDAKADAAADPAVKELTVWAQSEGVSQAALDKLLTKYAEIVEPEMSKMQIDIAAEKQQLGKNADAIIANTMDFFQQLYKAGHINDAMLAEAQILGETAAGIKFIQAVRSYYGEAPIPTNITANDGAQTKQELAAMVNDPKYDTDADYKAKVDAAYAKAYGNAPAMSSAQNR